MAKVKLNPVVEQMRGQIGDLVFRKAFDRIFVGSTLAPSLPLAPLGDDVRSVHICPGELPGVQVNPT
jgi:hypothetical protein